MENVTILKQTHFFEFIPEKQGTFEFAVRNRRLFNPEDYSFLQFPGVIAGLEPEDVTRINLRVFSDFIIGEIYTITSISGDLPDEVSDEIRKRNEKALAVAEEFLSDLRSEGIAGKDVRIEEGSSRIQKVLSNERG